MLNNKYYPAELKEAVEKSLSFYPELEDTEIHFRFARQIKHSVMQAQPKINTLIRSRSKRAYVIRMRKTFVLEGEVFALSELPFKVLVGWLGHELGHVMDYLDRSLPSMAVFGAAYVFSPNFVKGAERTADEFAVSRGMGSYIQATKNFILNHSDFSDKYKEKIRKLYLSPDEIMEIVLEHEMPQTLR